MLNPDNTSCGAYTVEQPQAISDNGRGNGRMSGNGAREQMTGWQFPSGWSRIHGSTEWSSHIMMTPRNEVMMLLWPGPAMITAMDN